MHIPISVDDEVFSNGEVTFSGCLLSISASNINGLYWSGLAWSGGGLGSDEIASDGGVYLELFCDCWVDSRKDPNALMLVNNSPVKVNIFVNIGKYCEDCFAVDSF